MKRDLGPLTVLYGQVLPSGKTGAGIALFGRFAIIWTGGWQINLFVSGWVFAAGLPLERKTSWYTTADGRRRCACGPFAMSYRFNRE